MSPLHLPCRVISWPSALGDYLYFKVELNEIENLVLLGRWGLEGCKLEVSLGCETVPTHAEEQRKKGKKRELNSSALLATGQELTVTMSDGCHTNGCRILSITSWGSVVGAGPEGGCV